MGNSFDTKEITSSSERIGVIVKRLSKDYSGIESSLSRIKSILNEIKSYDNYYASAKYEDGVYYRSRWKIHVSKNETLFFDDYNKKINLLYGEKLDLEKISENLSSHVRAMEKKLGVGVVRNYLYGDKDGNKKSIDEAKADFKKYDLSDNELLELARLCAQEQGADCLPGVLAEASLIANKYELSNGYDERGRHYDNIVDYAKYCGWWSDSKNVMENGSKDNKVSKQVLLSVKKVFFEGKRTLPKYVDEHDHLNDLSKVETDGSKIDKANSSQYVAHHTVCYQDSERIKGGEQWIYYSHPNKDGDPFGYSSVENMNKYGDYCYDEKNVVKEIESEIVDGVV